MRMSLYRDKGDTRMKAERRVKVEPEISQLPCDRSFRFDPCIALCYRIWLTSQRSANSASGRATRLA
jgi:hypothetical protein